MQTVFILGKFTTLSTSHWIAICTKKPSFFSPKEGYGIECLGDECLEVRQPHDLGVLPLVQDVVDANLADVEDAVVVGITARRQLPRIRFTQALGKRNKIRFVLKHNSKPFWPEILLYKPALP